jgi:hypothetical protein
VDGHETAVGEPKESLDRVQVGVDAVGSMEIAT